MKHCGPIHLPFLDLPPYVQFHSLTYWQWNDMWELRIGSNFDFNTSSAVGVGSAKQIQDTVPLAVQSLADRIKWEAERHEKFKEFQKNNPSPRIVRPEPKLNPAVVAGINFGELDL